MASPSSLNAVRVFVRVARHLSFQRAAGELYVTPGALSRQIQALEAALGVTLFERRHRAIALTRLGADYLARVGPAIDEIEQAGRALRETSLGRPSGGDGARLSVRLDATPTFAMHWLIPRLAEFRVLHPAVDVRLSTSQGPVERESGVDVHIRRDPAHFNGLPGEPFMTEHAVLVGSPALCERARCDAPAALRRLPAISMRSRPDLWPKCFARLGLDATGAPAGIELDNTILAIQAAVEGLGIGLFPRLFIEGLLAGGALRELPGTQGFASGTYHLLFAPQSASPAVPLLAGWLRENGDRG